MEKLLEVNEDDIKELSRWDVDDKNEPLAPLHQLQQDSFLQLASVASNRPMPIEVIITTA